jgi:hypothetical protein
MKLATVVIHRFAGSSAVLSDRLSKSLAALNSRLLRISDTAEEQRKVGRVDVILALGIGFFVIVILLTLVGAACYWYHGTEDKVKSDVKAIATFVGAALLAWAALRQAKTARLRHEEQTASDRQRHITESLSKAVEQLGSEKLAVRLGGIYTMERISRESRRDYWPVMETLTAFVRERAAWKRPDEKSPETIDSSKQAQDQSDDGVGTDIQAVLTVICRRDKANHENERKNKWQIDLRGTDLRIADLRDAQLEGAVFIGANLERAYFSRSNLKDAAFLDANLEHARLEDTILGDTYFWGANLGSANFNGAIGLEDFDLMSTRGDAKTKLPDGVERPADWAAE